MTARLRVVDYPDHLAFAPGIALIEAPRHTPGSQMVYVAPRSGKELRLAGDVAWHTGKDAPWIKEPAELMAAELAWLNGLSRTKKKPVDRHQPR